jgi:hypothetical protein
MLQPTSIRHLSSLQKAILQALSTVRHRRQPAETTAGVPYQDVVQAVAADKTTVTTSLRQLMRRGLVLIFVPPGAWTRWVALTAQGQEHVRFLARGAQQPSAQADTNGREEHAWGEKRQRLSTKRRDRSRSRRQSRDERRTRHRFR